MEAELIVNALKMACRNQRPSAWVIFHTDRGAQFNSELFKTFGIGHEIVQSRGEQAAAMTMQQRNRSSIRSWLNGSMAMDSPPDRLPAGPCLSIL